MKCLWGLCLFADDTPPVDEGLFLNVQKKKGGHPV